VSHDPLLGRTFRLKSGEVSSRKSKLVSNTLVWNGFKNGIAREIEKFEIHLLGKAAEIA
jgi:hypothetical protein